MCYLQLNPVIAWLRLGALPAETLTFYPHTSDDSEGVACNDSIIFITFCDCNDWMRFEET